MRRLIFLSFLIVAFTLATSLTSVSGQDRQNFVTVKAGVYTPNDDLEDLDSGFAGELSIGKYVNPNLALEGSIGYYETEGTFTGFDPFLFGFFTEKDDVSIIPITFSLKLIHPVEMGEIYTGGGLGIYFVDAEADINSTGLGNLSFGDNDNIFGVHLLVGMDFTIRGNWFLGIEGKYLITQEAEFTDNFMGIPITIETNLNGYVVTGVIGFRY